MIDKVTTIEVRQVLRAITHLNLIKTNLSIYPSGHIRIKESVDNAYDIIQDIHRKRPEVTIGVAGETLMFGETILDKKNIALRDYARSLNKFLILVFCLKKGITREDLLEFNRILSSNPSDIWSTGRIDTVLAKRKITGIVVKGIDADVLNLMDNNEFLRDVVPKHGKGEDSWQEFIASLLLRASGSTRQGAGQDDFQAPPALVRGHLAKPQQVKPLAWDDGNMRQAPSRRSPPGAHRESEKSDALSSTNNLLQELHPALKEQLIAAAGKQIAPPPEVALVRENLPSFSQEMLLSMIQRENARKGRMSPSMLSLLNKLASAENTMPVKEHISGDVMSPQEIGSLFRSEQYEKYVPGDYETILKEAADASTVDPNEDNSFIKNYLKTITDEHIILRISQFILEAMDGTQTEETYLNYSQKLGLYIPELFRAGHFSFLTEVIDHLRRHGREKPFTECRQAAMSLLNSFSNSETIAGHLTPFIVNGSGDVNALAKLLTTSGIQHVSWLFDLYLGLPAPPSEALIDILKAFDRAAYDEACKRLSDQRQESIIRLLTFFQSIGNRTIVPTLKDLFEHQDFRVKRRVIEAYIQFEERCSAAALLRARLRSPHRQEVLYAITLICCYGFMELLGDMMSLMKTSRIREQDTALNEFIVSGLAATGDPAVVPYLKKIAGRRLSLSPIRMARLKRIITEELSNFK
jgi:hypothetical protein